jgi:hypothetical protein
MENLCGTGHGAVMKCGGRISPRVHRGVISEALLSPTCQESRGVSRIVSPSVQLFQGA